MKLGNFITIEYLWYQHSIPLVPIKFKSCSIAAELIEKVEMIFPQVVDKFHHPNIINVIKYKRKYFKKIII